MRKLCSLLGLLSACAGGGSGLPAAAQGETVLEVRGAIRAGPYLLGRADLDRLPRRHVRGVDPATGRAATWEGVSLAALVIERVELAKGADTVIVRTRDRTAIPIPLTLIRQLKPVLADRADGVRIASAVVAWPTLEQRGLETDPRAGGWWTRDVVVLEIVDWQRAFGAALATPDGAADEARRGSAWFGDRCMSCHRLRGAGGERGPDLTTVAARLRGAAFAALLERHPHGPGAGGEPLGAQEVEEIWSFLRAVAAARTGERPEAAPAGRGAPAAVTRP
jgi:mono/diheme cytochrome c family protein